MIRLWSTGVVALCLSLAAAALSSTSTAKPAAASDTTPQIYTHGDAFVPDAILRATQQNISIGGIDRLTVLVNGTVPGPELRLTEGEVYWIRVYNDLPNDNFTMHWHGLAQAAAPFSDGTPLTSQWPIPPNHYFDYEISIPKGSAGSYFYHSHVGFQTVSASGPLIVEEAGSPPYAVDGERTIYLQELFNKTDNTIATGLVSVPFVWSGETNGFMVNGATISNYANNTNTSSQQLAVIDVEPGQTYRFRFIGAQSLTYAIIGIANHTNLSIIEADGGYTKPYSVQNIQFGAGQRYSALLQTMQCSDLQRFQSRDFYIQIDGRERPANITNYAILRYAECNPQSIAFATFPTNSYPTTPPITLPPTDYSYLDYVLEPLQPNGFPPASAVTRTVVIDVQQIHNQSIIWRDDHVSWTDYRKSEPNQTLPLTPYLVALYENTTMDLPSYSAALANNGVDPRTQTFPGKIGEVIDIVLQNVGQVSFDGTAQGDIESHPFHAHGAHYYDLGGGPGIYNATLAAQRLNGTSPVLRDTTMLYRFSNGTTTPGNKNGWRAWRLHVTQPGAWLIHCHVLQHMIMGMQTVWVFGNTSDILGLPAPAVQNYLTFGGSAYGNESHAPKVVHAFGSPQGEDD